MRRLTIAALTLTTLMMTAGAAVAHEGEHYSAGEPGDASKPAQVIAITMHEGDGTMTFIPSKVEVQKGQQIKFVIRNDGALDHEFVLATTAENLKHAELMKKYPDMVHDDPNAKRIAPGKVDNIVWKFTKAGTFEYSCLIPGHREAGMVGTVVVK